MQLLKKNNLPYQKSIISKKQKGLCPKCKQLLNFAHVFCSEGHVQNTCANLRKK